MAPIPKDIQAGLVASGMTFSEKVWTVTSRIERGKVVTYGDIAAVLGDVNASRAVGAALGRNPYAPDVPCHRVVAGDGRLTGYAGGLPMKTKLLRDEGVTVERGRVTDLSAFRQRLDTRVR